MSAIRDGSMLEKSTVWQPGKTKESLLVWK